MTSRKQAFPAVSLVLWSVLALIVVAIVVLAILKKPPEQVAEKKEKSVPVGVMTLTARAVADVLTLPGRIGPAVEVMAATEKGGKVIDLAVDRGDRVEAGQVMLKLDSRVSEAMVKQMEIEFREAEKEVARWQELQKTGGVSASDFDRILKARDLAAVGLEQARIQVSQGQVRSSIAGVVDARFVEKGEFAPEGMAVFRVVDVDTVKVMVEVPEQDILKIRAGQQVPFRVSALPDAVLTGEVAFVSVLGSRESNSFQTELRARNPDRVLRPGMIVEAAFTRRVREDAVMAPLSALIPKRGEYVAFVVENGRAVSRFVRFDAMLGQDVVVAAGLATNDILVIEGQRGLQDGTLLDVKPRTD